MAGTNKYLRRTAKVALFDEGTGDILLVCTYDDLRNAAIALLEQANRDRELAMYTDSARHSGTLKHRASKMRTFAAKLLNLREVLDERPAPGHN